MVERVSFSLRQQIKLTGCVTIKVRYSDFETHTIQKRIAYTSFDHTIYEVAKEIFFKLYNRRVLVRLLGVKVSHLVTGEQQINMFEDSTELINLYQAIDKMKNRFGEKSITRGFRL
jgi:DNA polymerase IV